MHTGLKPPPSYRPLPHCHAWASSRRTQGYTGGEGKGPNGGGSSPAWALAGGQRRHLVLSESPGGFPSARGAVPPLLQAGGSANGRSAGGAAPVVRSLVGPGGGPGACLGGARRGAAEGPAASGRGVAQPMGAGGTRGVANGDAAGPARCRRRSRCSARSAASGCGPGPAAGTMYRRLPAGPGPLPARPAAGSLLQAARCSRVELTA